MSFLEQLAAHRRFGIKPGLNTIRALCSRLGDPQNSFKAIHVAGTNGKGAVCAILDSVLRHQGLIGRYTSPHLVRLNERFMLNGMPVDDLELESLSKVVASAVEGEVTFFEALTAVAFLLFRKHQVRHAILECGLGGRLDATNICSPELCVITKIGLDHCNWLGNTIEQIAAEKAGIIKPGVPIVLGRNCEAVKAVIENRADELGAPFHYAPYLVRSVPSDLSLLGCFNRENAITAMAALLVMGIKAKSLNQIVWPGRYQRIGKFIVDGAHNPPAAEALVAALKVDEINQLDLIAGFCEDKDVETVLRILSPYVRHGFAVKTNNPRSLSAEVTAQKMRAVGIDAKAMESLPAALSQANKLTLICGSLFLVGEALVALDAYPWGKARFDPAETLVASNRIGD